MPCGGSCSADERFQLSTDASIAHIKTSMGCIKKTKKHAKNDHLEHQATKAKTLALAQIASKYGKY